MYVLAILEVIRGGRSVHSSIHKRDWIRSTRMSGEKLELLIGIKN
jgi:hypothetical protein